MCSKECIVYYTWKQQGGGTIEILWGCHCNGDRLHVSGEIFNLMEQRKVSVEELDSVPLDQV